MFKFVLTNCKIREKMLDFLRPICSSNNDKGYRNINWAAGVYDDKKDIFITLIYYVPDVIARCDMDFYKYIVIVGDKHVFSVTNNLNCIAGYEFSISRDYQEFSEIIKEGIQLYSDNREYHLFKKNLKETGEISDYYSYYKDIRDQMNSLMIQ